MIKSFKEIVSLTPLPLSQYIQYLRLINTNIEYRNLTPKKSANLSAGTELAKPLKPLLHIAYVMHWRFLFLSTNNAQFFKYHIFLHL
ncbi:MAG: hypothetical protein ACUVQ1_09535 [Candidatus Kapaibacteriales bacterium]